MDEKELEQRIQDRMQLIEAIKAMECLQKQLNIAFIGINKLYTYDPQFAKKCANSIHKEFEKFVETSAYKEYMENAMLEDFFGINKT